MANEIHNTYMQSPKKKQQLIFHTNYYYTLGKVAATQSERLITNIRKHNLKV